MAVRFLMRKCAPQIAKTVTVIISAEGRSPAWSGPSRFPCRLLQERPVPPARPPRQGHTPPIPDSALRGLPGGNSAPAQGTLVHPQKPGRKRCGIKAGGHKNPPALELRPAERVGDEDAGVWFRPLGSGRGSGFPQRPVVGRFSGVLFGDMGAKRASHRRERPSCQSRDRKLV